MYLATICLLLSYFLHSAPVYIPLQPDSLGKGKIKGRLPVPNQTTTDSLNFTDSTFTLSADTTSRNDTIDLADDSEIKDIITYKADDSIVYDMGTKKMMLYNAGDVQYQKIKLNSNAVTFDWTTYTLSSEGTLDSAGNLTGTPVFSDDGKEFRAKKMDYNFRTKKGKVYEVITKEGDAYIHSETVKKNDYDEWYGFRSKYTTCDLDHPHFYFQAKKTKIVPNKVMVTGPTNLWVGDVPTPLVLPFGIFPIKQRQHSGLILPEYGQDAVMGFFLRNGGYYWSVNDYLSLKFLGQISTNGTFGLGVSSNYALRYKFTGSASFSYLRSRPFDPDLPNARATNSYSFSWVHTQDPRSMPNSTFGSTVQVQSADFYQASRVTDVRLLNTNFNSTINYSHNFTGTPLGLSVNMRHDQNLLNRTIGFTLPSFRLFVSRVSPFKAKIKGDTPKWFENIGIAYAFEAQSRVETYDSILFRYETLDKFRFGVNQTLRIDAPLRIFKYFNLTPTFDYQERTYFRGEEQRWNPDTVYIIRGDGGVDTLNGRVQKDTTWRFNSARNFSASIALSTKIVGIYNFKNKYIKAFRHIFTPSVSFGYHPDFSTNFWRYYRTVQTSATGETGRYSVFEPNPIYGIPGGGREGSIRWTLANNFEMKTYSKKDTVNHEKKMGLIDQLTITGGYNFMADSLRWQQIGVTANANRVFNLINLLFSVNFDPYATDSLGRPINTFQWQKKRSLLRFVNANFSANMSLHSKMRTPVASADAAAPSFISDYVSYNPNQLYSFDIPWNVNMGYRFNLTRGTTFNPDTLLTTQVFTLSGDFNLTPHWKFAISSGFDITRKQITLTNITVVRDLHCWELSFNWTPPLPTFPQQQFSIILHPKSPTLKDLKLQKKNSLQNF